VGLCKLKEGTFRSIEQTLREPIVSMGDRRKPRQGLTKRERGIPLGTLNGMLGQVGFEIMRHRLCMSPIVSKAAARFGVHAFSSPFVTVIDSLVSRCPAKQVTYHRSKLKEKIAPTSVFAVLRKN
jgi:hypothetical protein